MMIEYYAVLNGPLAEPKDEKKVRKTQVKRCMRAYCGSALSENF
jgi:hypothetical protein